MTLSITMLRHFAECHFAECRILLIAMPNVVMLSVIMLGVVMLSVVVPFATLNQGKHCLVFVISFAKNL
jgi:hypothetical protein